MAKVVALLRKLAPDDNDVRRLGKPAAPAEIAAVETALGVPLPPDVVAMWSAHGHGIPILEYSGMSPERALERRSGLEELRLDGTFDNHELFPQRVQRIAAVKWHTHWLPIAEDGGGNLWCVDLAPGPKGRVGQVIEWEMRGGAGASSSVTLAELFTRYAAALPKFVYDANSGIFDGPFVDLLK